MMENDACLLGSLNLSEYVINRKFNFNAFNYDVIHAIKALNEVQKESIELLPLEKQRKQAKEWCRIGLGVMGLADMLIKLEIPYGSKSSIELCDRIARSLAVYSLLGSMRSKEEPFKYFDSDKIQESKYYQNVVCNDGHRRECFPQVFSLHNSALLAIAPTGSLSSMLGISGGIEPIYDLSYTRKTESLNDKDTYYKVYTPIVKNYMDNNDVTSEKELPPWFVTAKSINVNNRLKMQATWQKYIDQAISSTVNLPEETTPEEIRELYIKAWKDKLKGVTIYRDNCARTGILSSSDNKTGIKKQIKPIETPKNVVGKKRKLITGCGSLHCLAFFDKDTGDLLETFLNKGSTGGCGQFMTGLSRMISLALRSGCSIDDVVDQLKSTGVCPSYAVKSAKDKNTSRGSCCPMAVANAIIDMHNEMINEINNKKLDNKKHNEYNVIKDTNKDNKVDVGTCPECGAKLRFEGGCNSCPECGYSRCS